MFGKSFIREGADVWQGGRRGNTRSLTTTGNAATRSRLQQAINVLVFGGFFAIAITSQFVEQPPNSVLEVLALCIISLLGYVGASSGRFARPWGIAAFLIGWFGSPAVGLGLAALAWVAAAHHKAKRSITVELGDSAKSGTLVSSSAAEESKSFSDVSSVAEKSIAPEEDIAGTKPKNDLLFDQAVDGGVSSLRKVLHRLIFAGLAFGTLLSFFVTDSRHSLWDVVVLCVITVMGYAYASMGRLSLVWGVSAFVLGWFWMPTVAAALLWVAAGLRRSYFRVKERHAAQAEVAHTRREIADEQSSAGIEAGQTRGEEDALARSLLSLKVATEYEDKVVRLAAEFHSIYGDGMIPILIKQDGGERGIYVEAGPWEAQKQENALHWLGLLRTSEREDLEVEFRSDVEIPRLLTFYANRTPRVLFELAGLLNHRWVPTPNFAELNAQTLKRLLQEYMEVDLPEGIGGLERLDAFVVDVLRGTDPESHMLLSTTILLGSFFGEVLRKQSGGRWLVDGETIDDVVLEVSSEVGTCKANVFLKVRKLFSNGIEDSTAWMARIILERMGFRPT